MQLRCRVVVQGGTHSLNVGFYCVGQRFATHFPPINLTIRACKSYENLDFLQNCVLPLLELSNEGSRDRGRDSWRPFPFSEQPRAAYNRVCFQSTGFESMVKAWTKYWKEQTIPELCKIVRGIAEGRLLSGWQRRNCRRNSVNFESQATAR